MLTAKMCIRDSWETMQAENIGYLLWGGVGTGKSYLAACIANALKMCIRDRLCAMRQKKSRGAEKR